MEDARTEAMTRADRYVRRGDMAEAIHVLDEWLAAHPDDTAARSRRDSIRSLGEVGPARPPTPMHVQRAVSEEEQAEMFLVHGRIADAVKVYERLVAERPNNELAQERLAELRLQLPPPPKPKDPVAKLEWLLARVQANRRP